MKFSVSWPSPGVTLALVMAAALGMPGSVGVPPARTVVANKLMAAVPEQLEPMLLEKPKGTTRDAVMIVITQPPSLVRMATPTWVALADVELLPGPLMDTAPATREDTAELVSVASITVYGFV